MNAPIPFRWRRAVALGLVSLPLTGPVGAAEPWPDPPPARPPVRTVEILYGTTRVWPVAPPVVVPAPSPPKPRPGPVMPAMRPPQIWEDPPPRVWEDPRAEPRPEPHPEPRPETPVIEVRPIILTGHSIPATPFGPGFGSAPWLNPLPAAPLPVIPVPPAPTAPVQVAPAAMTPAPVQAQAAPAQPTVVVVREPADSRPTYLPAPAESPRGITLGSEALLGIALGAAGLGFGYAGWKRKAATPGGVALAIPAAPHNPADGVLLMGKYNAGPRKETAERFEIGPSYQTQQQEKKKTAEQEQAAVLEFILSQNIALHADIAGPDDDSLPEADELDAPADVPGERGA